MRPVRHVTMSFDADALSMHQTWGGDARSALERASSLSIILGMPSNW
jgi:hypothetical protein